MKRSIAFLLAMIMVIGAIPMTLLPVLAHGLGVGVDDVQNLSIDNAPNQKIPATVTVDGKSDDTAWISDKWQLANAQSGIWNVDEATNPDFVYRYQMHTDYEFLYGIFEIDMNQLGNGTLADMTVWLNDGNPNANHYSTKVVITPVVKDDKAEYKIELFRHGSDDAINEDVDEGGFAQYTYEFAFVTGTEANGILTLEFKALLDSILGKEIDKEKVDVNLTSFVSANIKVGENNEYFYHPRVDAAKDDKQINLGNKWEDGAVEISQNMIYATSADPKDADKRTADATDFITIDGHLDEETWKNFNSYGGSNFETYTDYLKYSGHMIPNYDVEYSTEYMYHDGTHEQKYDDKGNLQTLNTYSDKWVHWHVNNVDFMEDPGRSTGHVSYTKGYFNGTIWDGGGHTIVFPKENGVTYQIGAQKPHVCEPGCQDAYLNNVPVKFKFQFKSDGENIYGAMVVDLDVNNNTFYYDTTNGRNTYFKVMIAGKGDKADGSNPWTAYTQLELQHTLTGGTSIHNFSDADYNKRVITSNSLIGKSNNTDNYGNTILPSDVGAYARRINSSTMVFEFCISYKQLNDHINKTSYVGNYQFKPGDDISVILSVGNESSGPGSTGSANNDNSAYGVHASNANWFGHRGTYDVLGRENTHKYKLNTKDTPEADPKFSVGRVNGSLDAGVFNGLRAVDSFINSSIRENGANFQLYSYTSTTDRVINGSNSKGEIHKGTYKTGQSQKLAGAGPIEFMDYDLFMSTEYLYGAAIIKKNGYEIITSGGIHKAESTKSTQFDEQDMFRLWLNNGNAQWRDRWDYVLNFYLDPEADQLVNLAPCTNTKSTYESTGTLYAGTDLEKGVEFFSPKLSNQALLDAGVEYSRVSLNKSKEYISNHSSGSGGEQEGEIVVIEFKIPLELLGVSEKHAEQTNGKSDVALSYYVNATGRTDGVDGICAPISNNRNLNSSGQSGLVYGLRRQWLLTVEGGGAWISTSYSGVDGANFIKTESKTNQFVIDGILDDTVWNDEEERFWVNSTSGSWGNMPDVPHMFDYDSAVYVGREYIYGAAKINTSAGDKEELIYTLWIKNDLHKPVADQSLGANLKFSIVQKGGTAVCYDIKGKEIPLVREETVYDSTHKKTYTLAFHDGIVCMTNANGVTYVEYMFSLEALGITLHAEGEEKYTQYFTKMENNSNSESLAYTDKFFYYWDGSNFVENKKLGFEYFVSVTKMDSECGHNNTLYYPAPKVVNANSQVVDKFCHIADADSYNNELRWDEANAHVITPIDYFVPETITIDGNVSDNGWADDKWIEVVEGVNGNLQNPVSQMQGASETPYKYQIRYDNENVYVAVVLDTPAHATRYVINGTEHYSIPRARLWIKSHDTDFNVTVEHSGIKVENADGFMSSQHTYTYDDAISFTHLYDVSLGYDSKTGEISQQAITIPDAMKKYVPETYVTWEDDGVLHYPGNRYSSLDNEVEPSQLIVTGTSIRFASHDAGFFAPNGGRARNKVDPVSVLRYKYGNGTWIENTSNKTNVEKNLYGDSIIYGSTKVVEENSVTAKNSNGQMEKEYVDKDWYAKPEVKAYYHGTEQAVMTSDETGTKTIVEFKFSLAEIGCDDGETFEYFMQGGTDGYGTDNGYVLFNPPIKYGFSKTTPDEAGKVDGRPYWYWASTGYVVDAAERERLKLRNNYEPVTPIGAQYKENFVYDGYSYLGMKFGVLYDADYMRQPRNTETDIYKNATYWDLKEIGMMVGYTDYLEGDVSNLTSDCADDYNIYRIESDVILNHITNTNMADYESYIFYATQLLWPDEYDTKLTYRGFVEYYPSDHMYYDMAKEIFNEEYPWTYSTPKANGSYSGKPLQLAGVNNDPTKIPTTYNYRPTFYSDPVTRTANMIKYANEAFKDESDLPGNRTDEVFEKPNASGSKILYVPIDDRPINVERVQYQAEAAGFELVMPELDWIATRIDNYQEGKSDQGDPKKLYTWLKEQYESGDYRYIVISLDQMFSGGLMGSREPFYDTEDSIANIAGLNGYDINVGGYKLSDSADANVVDEKDMVDLLARIAADTTVESIFFDTVKRLACSGNFFDMQSGDNGPDYNNYRIYGTFARPQLYGNALTIENIVAGYNKRADGSVIAMPLSGAPTDVKNSLTAQGFNANTDYYFAHYKYTKSGEEINDRTPSDQELAETNADKKITVTYYGLEDLEMYIAARERKLRIAAEIYPTIADNSNCFYVGYDDSKPFTTIQTNEGRYIEDKLIAGKDNASVFSGADELGMMSIAKIATTIYGSVSINPVFFGLGRDQAGDDYDTGNLYDGTMAHINGIGATYDHFGEGEVDVLILSRTDNSDGVGGTSDADLEQLRIHAGKLIDRVDANLKAGKPTIVVDATQTDDGYLANMMMQRYATSYHNADISDRLNQLLSYSHWNTVANSLGTAISNGISRYTYLKNCAPEGITEESHQAAYTVNTKAWVKDYGYQSKEIGASRLNRNNPYNGSSNFAKPYNSFWEINKYIMPKLNASSVVTGINEDGTTIVPSTPAYQTTVSNLWWRWDRGFEANFDIQVHPKQGFVAPDYGDYKVVNLALGKSYTTSWSWDNSVMSTPENSYEDYQNQELTNGVRVIQESGYFGYGASYWGGWSFAHPDDVDPSGQTIDYKDKEGNMYFDVTIDLGENYPIYQVNLDNLSMGVKNGKANDGIVTPSKIQLFTSTSEDSGYVLQRTIQPETQTSASVSRYYLGTNSKAAEARYVKLRIWKNNAIGTSTWVFISEIEVLGIDTEGLRPEYIDTTGLYFSYQAAPGEEVYIPINGNTGEAYKNADGTTYLIADDTERLRMYWTTKYDQKGNENKYYFNNLSALSSDDKIYGYFNHNLSGWKLAADKADSVGIDLSMSGNFMITQIDVHMATKFWGYSEPDWAKLYMIDGNGNETLIDTRFYKTRIYEGETNGDGTYDRFEGVRYAIEVLNGPIYFPDNAKIRVVMGRDKDSGADAFIFSGIKVIGNWTDAYVSVEEAPKPDEQVLLDSSYLTNYADAWKPAYAPFSLYDTSLFSDTVVTEISFPYYGLANNYTTADGGLYFPVYVIKNDLSDTAADCTYTNGKKYVLDFSGKLNGVKQGDWITASGLDIRVGPDETLAFGDANMTVIPYFLRGNSTYGFYNTVFTNKSGNDNSLIFKIKGYSNKTIPSNDDNVNTISFLGDSISTYTGWSNNINYNSTIGANAIWYPTNANIAVEDTWWHKTADELDYEICVNNSWSGSKVLDATTYNSRSRNLHNTTEGVSPDIVVIFMGINDCAANTAVGNYDGTGTPPVNPTTFSEAYGRTIKNIYDTYEGVEIYCCTVLPDEKRAASDNESEYNAAIRTIATNMGATVIDLYAQSGITASNISTYTVDSLHPNAAGMQLIADVVVNAINN